MYGSIPSSADDGSKSMKRADSKGGGSFHSPKWDLSKNLQLVIACAIAFLAGSFLNIFGSTPLQTSSCNGSYAADHQVLESTSSLAVSARGHSIKAVRDDLPIFLKGASDAYHPETNPEGYLVMLVAENKMMWKEMASKLEAEQAANPLPEWIFGYGDMGGEANFKAAMGSMMSRWIDAPIDPQYLRFQAGAGSVLDQISIVLTDENDGVLITAPGYLPLEADMGLYGRTKTHLAHTHASNGYVPTVNQLEDCFQRSVEAGNPPKILVLIQPNNPTGAVYPHDSMVEIIQWALSKGLHVVSDEIYALSTFPGVQVTSAADVMWELSSSSKQDDRYLGDYVHIVAGLSKDWGMSGFRVGSLLSHNLELLQALDDIGYYQSVSMYTQHALTNVFRDEEWVDWYIGENQKRLQERYQALERTLEKVNVPLFPAQGSIFAWANFSSFILEGQTEKDLWLELFHDAKIALTTGYSCGTSEPGMFRIVYTWPEGHLEPMEEFENRLVQWSSNRQRN